MTEKKIDQLVGRNVRRRRKGMNMSQAELGSALGLTFQQVQKMEKGVNRIGAGRLELMAAALGCSRDDFYDGDAIHTLSNQNNSVADENVPEDRRFMQHFLRLPRNIQTRLTDLLTEINELR